MSESDDLIPPLRAFDCTVLNTGDQKMIRLRDGLGISPEAAVPLPLFALIQLFNGKRSILDVQAEIARETGEIFPGADLRRIVAELDQAYLLDSRRFRERLQQIHQEWSSASVRPAVHAGEGRCYSDEKEILEEEMKSMYRRPGAADPARLTSSRPLRAVLAPHIDFQRGGHCYTWAYHEIRRRGRAPLFVILGTCHQGMQHPFAVTRKSFATPWGPVATDGRFIDRLEERFGESLLADEFQHKNEHSIEFQVVFLRHALGEMEFSIVPILCGGFHELIQKGLEPASDPGVARFLDSLAGAVAASREEDGREVIFIGGVDLAHVGQNFGDADRLSPELLERVREQDEEFLKKTAALDASGIFEHMVRDGDRRRICGFGPIYTILGALERTGPREGRLAGDVLLYDQAVDRENDICVSFASMTFEEK